MKKKVMTKSDARFARCDDTINNALYRALSERNINLRPKDICAQAKITRPTFYAHCANSTDALHQHEAKLENAFYDRLPKRTIHNEVIFTVLLCFIREHSDYFAATIKTANFYLLKTIFQNLKPIIVGSRIDGKSYALYTLQQIGLITCWATYEGYSSKKIAPYAKKMQATRVMRVGV